MFARLAVIFAATVLVSPAMAEPLGPEQARRFVVGKLFSFNCFEGTRGAGRIHGDGSVRGVIQFRGSGPVRRVRMPANTLQVVNGSVCASVRGLPIQPCFNVVRTGRRSFRGSISGLNFAYCDFQRGRMKFAETPAYPQLRGTQAVHSSASY